MSWPLLAWSYTRWATDSVTLDTRRGRRKIPMSGSGASDVMDTSESAPAKSTSQPSACDCQPAPAQAAPQTLMSPSTPDSISSSGPVCEPSASSPSARAQRTSTPDLGCPPLQLVSDAHVRQTHEKGQATIPATRGEARKGDDMDGR